MQNVSDPRLNATSQRSVSVVVKVCVVVPVFCVFLCCVAVMLHVFASRRHFLETSRYVLFAHMLVNDTLQVLSSVALFLLAMARVRFAVAYCVPLLLLSTVTFQNTPLILAAMSLERHAAILRPLRRPAAWRSDRVWVVVLCLWLASCLFTITEFSLGGPDAAVDVFSTPTLCKSVTVNSSPVQALFRAAASVLFFAAVAAVILFTYVRILLETRTLRQDKASVSRAMHTVLLHAFQLLLSVLAFTDAITASLVVLHADWPPEDVAFFNYFSFILVPRFLSPLIYGFRDRGLRAHLATAVLRCAGRVRPGAALRPWDGAPAS